MKHIAKQFLVILIIFTLFGCGLIKKSSTLTCEKVESIEIGEKHSIISYYIENDIAIEKSVKDTYTFSSNQYDTMLDMINENAAKMLSNDVSIESTFVGNTEIIQNTFIDLRNPDIATLELLELESTNNKGKIVASKEKEVLEKQGYFCKIDSHKTNNELIVRSVRLVANTYPAQVDAVGHVSYGECVGVQVQLVYEPYDISGKYADKVYVKVCFPKQYTYDYFMNFGMKMLGDFYHTSISVPINVPNKGVASDVHYGDYTFPDYGGFTLEDAQRFIDGIDEVEVKFRIGDEGKDFNTQIVKVIK